MFLVKTDASGYTMVEDIDAAAAPLLLVPNPATDHVRIITDREHPASITITDATGKRVFSIAAPVAAMNELDVGFLSDGIYQVMGTFNDGQVAIGRLVIAH